MLFKVHFYLIYNGSISFIFYDFLKQTSKRSKEVIKWLRKIEHQALSTNEKFLAQDYTVCGNRNLRTWIQVFTSECLSFRLSPSMVNKLLIENSVAAHWFLPFQKYVTPKDIYPLTIGQEICKSTFYYSPSLLRHHFDVLIHNSSLSESRRVYFSNF